jgi:hypothetical protein
LNDEVNDAIKRVCKEIMELLLTKNRKYNNSIFNPTKIFSKSEIVDQINTRIDDKLSRIKNQQEDEDEDAELDLIGYLILKRVYLKHLRNNSNIIESPALQTVYKAFTNRDYEWWSDPKIIGMHRKGYNDL